MNWWSTVLAALVAVAAFGAVLAAVARPLMRAALNLLTDSLLERLGDDRYGANLFGAVNALRRLGPETTVETMMRAAHGQALSRPLGSPRHPSPWDHLLFQPVYLRPRLPTPERVEIETATVVGPRATRPLRVDIPVLIAGMSYGGALSVDAKVALARGANLAGTATNAGESFLPEERRAADRLIMQHHRGLWPNGTMNRPQLLGNADAIEIQLGQGAQAAAAMRTPVRDIDARMRNVLGLAPGRPAEIATRFRGVDTPGDFAALVRRLKAEYEVPVGVKVGAGDHLEDDLDVLLEGGADFVTVDGAEGGTHGGPVILQDDVGLPTLHAVVRADEHLRRRGVRERVTLLAGGQLTTPGRMLKALALGADAVYIGGAAICATIGGQERKAFPGEPAYVLVLQGAGRRWTRRLDVDAAANHLARYLRSVVAEMRSVAQALGRARLAEIDRSDLAALDAATADLCGVRLAWRPRAQAQAFGAPVKPAADGAAHNGFPLRANGVVDGVGEVAGDAPGTRVAP